MTKNIRTCSGPQLGSGHDFFDGTSLLADHGALRRRAEADGYVYMKGLLDPKLVRSLRATVLELCASYGWLDDRYPVIEGVARPGTCIVEGKSDAWFNYYSEVLRLRELYALAWNDTLIETVRCILGHNVLPHPCSIARTKFPEATHSDKPPHQDYRFVGGTVNTWTVWIPCGDCPREVGGLAILPGSHTAGELPVQFRDGRNEVALPLGLEWVSADMKAGDFVMFSALTVHRSLPNQSGTRLRLSVDYRYQPLNEPVRFDSLLPHLRLLGWDEIYEGWPTEDSLKNYWRQMPVIYSDT